MCVSRDTAIERARAALGLDVRVPASAHYVERMDCPGTSYYLVGFGDENHALGVAVVDDSTGEVSSYASVGGTRPHLPVSAARASELSGAPPIDLPRLVWRPCRASQSMLSPIWEIRTADGVVFVDQQSRIWTRLEPAAPGG